MVSLHPISSSPSSSFPSTSRLFSDHFSVPLSASLHLHGWFSLSLTNFKTNKSPLLAAGLKPSKHILIQCNVITSSTTPTTPTTNLCSEIEMSFFSLFREIGIDEREAELLLKENPSLNFTPFRSVHSRVISLQQLGINGLALCRLITKRPYILTAKEIETLINFISNDLEESKIEPTQLGRLLNVTDFRIFEGFGDKVKLLQLLGIPLPKLAHVLNNVNLTKAICLKSAEEIERTITFLNRFGGWDLILKRPAILNFDLDTQLAPRIEVFTQLSGGDEAAAGTVIRKLPAVLAYSSEHLNDHVEFLRSFAGLSDQEIFRIVLVYPNVFSASRKRKLHPRIDFLKQCGLSSNDIFKFLIKAPLFLSLSFRANLAYKLVFLVKIGYENRTKELAIAMGAVTRTSCKNMQETIGLFLNYGLSCDDVLAMSKKHPQILQYNHESLDEKMDYLVEEMGREVGELLAFPAFLGYKLDSRIKHRYEVQKGILGEGMSLNKLLSVSTESFSMKKLKNHVL